MYRRNDGALSSTKKGGEMKQLLKGALALCFALSGAAQATVVGYDIGVTTFYQFGVPADLTFSDFGVASPDTGYWRVTNNGTTTFSGTIGQNALAGNGVSDFSYSHAVALAPGASVVFAVNSESSNVGGFGGSTGSTQNGIEIFLNGLFEGTEAVSLSVFDKDIHSGVPRVNPFGETVDSYVLQGGDSLGRDTSDDFEVSQSPGQFRFIERVGTVPEPSTLVLLAVSCIGLGWSVRRT
jgi:PEP-CTERM motif